MSATGNGGSDRPAAHRLLYVADAQVPGVSAPAVQVMRMCDAFAGIGYQVQLSLPEFQSSFEDRGADVAAFYGLHNDFRIKRRPIRLSAGLMSRRRMSTAVRTVSYAISLPPILRRRHPPDWIYGRPLTGLWTARRLTDIGFMSGPRIVAELHDLPQSASGMRLLERMDGVVVISEQLRSELLARVTVPEARVIVAPNGYDGDAARMETEAARAVVAERHDLDVARPLAVYVGRVDLAKGVGVILDAAQLVPDVQLLVVGHQWDQALAGRARSLGNVTMTGYVPPADVATYLDAADLLLLPSTSHLPYASVMSPLKLFEYMHSGKPVIASDLPTIAEFIVDGESGLLVTEDAPAAWAEAIRRLAGDAALATTLGDNAQRRIAGHSWTDRARRIADWMTELPPR